MVVFGTIIHRLLYLYGDMADAKFLVGDSAQTTQKRFKVPLVIGVNEHVGGEGVVAGGNGPSVNVMHQGNTFHFLQGTAEPVHIQPGRYALQQHAKYLDGQTAGTHQDQYGDENTEDGVNKVPVKGQCQDTGDNHSDGAHQVGHNMPEGALNC